MEAVRALQPVKSDDPPAGGASVTVQGDEVLIEHLSVEDRTLVELIEHRRDREIAPEETVSSALEIGARVLDREATGAEVDAIRRELERASAEAEHAFAERAAASVEKQFGSSARRRAMSMLAHGDELVG
jgi:hypothetical protein